MSTSEKHLARRQGSRRLVVVKAGLVPQDSTCQHQAYVTEKAVEAAALRREAALAGDADSADLHRQADDADAEANRPVVLSDPTETAGGEPPLSVEAKDWRDRELIDTVRNPTLVTASAALQRTRKADRAGCLELALDTADTIKAKNNLERMLAHQLAAAHNAAMTLMAGAMYHLKNGVARPDGVTFTPDRMERLREHNVEGVRLSNAYARMMQAYCDGVAALGQMRRGGQQHVKVVHQYVNVADGGQAVVCAQHPWGSPTRKAGREGEGEIERGSP